MERATSNEEASDSESGSGSEKASDLKSGSASGEALIRSYAPLNDTLIIPPPPQFSDAYFHTFLQTILTFQSEIHCFHKLMFSLYVN